VENYRESSAHMSRFAQLTLIVLSSFLILPEPAQDYLVNWVVNGVTGIVLWGFTVLQSINMYLLVPTAGVVIVFVLAVFFARCYRGRDQGPGYKKHLRQEKKGFFGFGGKKVKGKSKGKKSLKVMAATGEGDEVWEARTGMGEMRMQAGLKTDMILDEHGFGERRRSVGALSIAAPVTAIPGLGQLEEKRDDGSKTETPRAMVDNGLQFESGRRRMSAPGQPQSQPPQQGGPSPQDPPSQPSSPLAPAILAPTPAHPRGHLPPLRPEASAHPGATYFTAAVGDRPPEQQAALYSAAFGAAPPALALAGAPLLAQVAPPPVQQSQQQQQGQVGSAPYLHRQSQPQLLDLRKQAKQEADQSPRRRISAAPADETKPASSQPRMESPPVVAWSSAPPPGNEYAAPPQRSPRRQAPGPDDQAPRDRASLVVAKLPPEPEGEPVAPWVLALMERRLQVKQAMGSGGPNNNPSSPLGAAPPSVRIISPAHGRPLSSSYIAEPRAGYESPKGGGNNNRFLPPISPTAGGGRSPTPLSPSGVTFAASPAGSPKSGELEEVEEEVMDENGRKVARREIRVKKKVLPQVPSSRSLAAQQGSGSPTARR
jgi:hypothetical protein